MTRAEVVAELALVRERINGEYWTFTRTARGRPVDRALFQREAELERRLHQLPDNKTTLRDAIAASGLSQVVFAGLLGVDPSTVRRWLSGAREVPPTVLVVCMAIIREPAIVAALAPQ